MRYGPLFGPGTEAVLAALITSSTSFQVSFLTLNCVVGVFFINRTLEPNS